MRSIELPRDLVEFIRHEERCVLVYDYGKVDQDAFFEYGVHGEETVLRASDGEEISFQSTTLTKINSSATVTLVDARNASREYVGVAFYSLFRTFTVILMTIGDRVVGFAPIFSSKLELAVFVQLLRDSEGEDFAWSRKCEQMISLAKFLFKHNPNKEDSVLDEIE